MRTGLLAILIVAVAALGTTAAALAQGGGDPAASQYEAPVASADSADPKKEEPSGLEGRIGRLPFTGLDLIVLGGVALVITGTGFALHRLSAPRV